MGANALEAALQDFGAPSEQPFAMADPFAGSRAEPVFEMPPPDEGPDIDTLIAQAVADAEEALAIRLAAQHAEAFAAERQRHDEEMQTLNARIGQEIGTRVASAVSEMEDRVVDLTGAVAARILSASLLTEELRERSIAALAETIRNAMQDEEALRVNVSGPASLHESLCAALPDGGARIRFTETAGLDLTVTLDESVYETRIGEWSKAMSEILT